MDGSNNKLKSFFFHLIAVIPLLILILFAVYIGFGVLRAARPDYTAMRNDLENYLKSEKGELRFSDAGKDLILDYRHKARNASYKPSGARFSMEDGGAERLVYVYGSSPLVTKLFSTSKSALFPARLEDRLNSAGGAKYKVFNFGVVSFDSFEIKEIVKATVGRKKPDLIIFYEGHMDYESAYAAAVKQCFFIIRRGAYVKIVDYIFEHKFPGYRAVIVADWILRSAIEPNLINFLQRIGALTLEEEPFREYDGMILAGFKKNLGEVITVGRENGIPVVVVTPIANMLAKPFGIYDMTEKNYRYALREDDYASRMTYLVKAVETEIFTGDLRAKPGLYAFIKGLSGHGGYVFDLEGDLQKEKFPFDYTYFYDIGHMKPELHEIVAERLYGFLREKKLVE